MFIFVIKQLREARNISRYKLAKMTNLSKPYIIALEENKKNNPTVKTLSIIANALSVNIKDLFYSTVEIENLKQEMYKRIDQFGIGSAEVMEISQIIDLLVNIEMQKKD